MAQKKQHVLGRLRTAIQKVKFLLSFQNSRWLLSSFLTRLSSPTPRLSFKNAPAGLLDCTVDDDFYEVGSTLVLSRTTSMETDISRSASLANDISRSTSDASAADDIDRRANDFIANFYKHIQIERQVSLELRYLKGKDGSLERTTSD